MQTLQEGGRRETLLARCIIRAGLQLVVNADLTRSMSRATMPLMGKSGRWSSGWQLDSSSCMDASTLRFSVMTSIRASLSVMLCTGSSLSCADRARDLVPQNDKSAFQHLRRQEMCIMPSTGKGTLGMQQE